MNDIKAIRLFNIYGFTGMNYAGNVWDLDGLSPALLTMTGGNRQPLIIDENGGNKMGKIRIRKLTPTECYKLMGFTEEDCKKCSAGGISNAQLYKQAGNSIVVNVLEAIFTSLGENYGEFKTN